jgi:hypothetical protein
MIRDLLDELARFAGVTILVIVLSALAVGIA